MAGSRGRGEQGAGMRQQTREHKEGGGGDVDTGVNTSNIGGEIGDSAVGGSKQAGRLGKLLQRWMGTAGGRQW